MWGRDEGRIEEYKALPLFEGCSRSELRQVARVATRLSPRAGTVLVRERRRVGEFVIVLGGAAEVCRGGRPIDEIRAGGFFGEIALVRRIHEPATVVARTPMTIDVIARQHFAMIYVDLDLVRRRVDDQIDQRLAEWIKQPTGVRARGAFAIVS